MSVYLTLTKNTNSYTVFNSKSSAIFYLNANPYSNAKRNPEPKPKHYSDLKPVVQMLGAKPHPKLSTSTPNPEH